MYWFSDEEQEEYWFEKAEHWKVTTQLSAEEEEVYFNDYRYDTFLAQNIHQATFKKKNNTNNNKGISNNKPELKCISNNNTGISKNNNGISNNNTGISKNNNGISKNNNSKFKCICCGQKFSSKFNCQRHQKLKHENIFDFQCNLCQKKFKLKQNLTVHYRIHTGEKPYECNKCQKKFTTHVQLKRHKKKETLRKNQ